jgi:hypothetical protein
VKERNNIGNHKRGNWMAEKHRESEIREKQQAVSSLCLASFEGLVL